MVDNFVSKFCRLASFIKYEICSNSEISNLTKSLVFLIVFLTF